MHTVGATLVHRITPGNAPCVHGPSNSRIVGQQKAGREPSLGTSVRNERPVTHISSERGFCPLPFVSLASWCVFLSAYAHYDWKRALQSTADSMRAQDFGEGQAVREAIHRSADQVQLIHDQTMRMIAQGMDAREPARRL